MSSRYQKEVLLRPAVELYSALVAGTSAFCLISMPGLLMIPWAIAYGASVLFLMVGCYDFYRGYCILHYRRGISRQGPFEIRGNRVPVYQDRLYIGTGFEWGQKHTQRYLDTFDDKYLPYIKKSEHHLARRVERMLRQVPVLSVVAFFLKQTWVLNPWPPKAPLGGDVSLNGVEHRQHKVFLPKSDRRQHTYMAGSTGTGKTEAMELMIVQDIHRSSRDCVIVFDPKGSASLLKTMYAEAINAGRADDFTVFHLGFPDISAMYNATGNFSRITEVSSRLANQLPDGGDSSAFKEFGWQFMNLVVRVSDEMTIPVTLVSIRKYIGDIGPLYLNYARQALTSKYGPVWIEHFNDEVRAVVDAEAKSSKSSVIGYLSGRPVEEQALHNLLRKGGFVLSENQLFLDLEEVFKMSASHYGKLVASVRPLLDKLTAGQLELIMSPSEEEISNGRKLLEWEQIIRKKGIVYIGLDAMADFTVASAVGNAMLMDFVSTASRIYKEGVLGDTPGGIPSEEISVWMYLDEVDALVGDEFIPMVNKIRGAGVGIVALSQAVQDFEVALNSVAKQKVIIGNFNNVIMFRVRNVETAALIADQSPTVRVLQLTDITTAQDTDNMLDGSLFKSANEDRSTHTETAMITEWMVMRLPIGQAFASVEGGRLMKLHFPFRVRQYDQHIPSSITDMALQMERRYRAGNDWYKQD